MAVGDPYVALAVFKASASVTDDATDADCTTALLAASRAVEACTNRRTFWKDAAPTTRTYTATSPGVVLIDDTTTVTALTVDGVALASTQWYPMPANAVADGTPYTWIQRRYYGFPTTFNSIAVLGTYGWPAVPFEVTQMVTILAEKLLKRTREAPWGMVSVGGVEGSAMRLAQTDPDLALLIGTYDQPAVG